MLDEVVVHVNRDGPGTLAAEPTELETETSFQLVLRNRSTPAHVHCRLDGDLASVATIDETHYYVETDEEALVPVIVDSIAEPVSGTLEVSTGYGATTVSISVTVVPGPDPVDVDETLSTPAAAESESADRVPASLPGGVDPGTVGVALLALVAIAIAVAATAIVDGAAAILGALFVFVGVAVAILLLLR